ASSSGPRRSMSRPPMRTPTHVATAPTATPSTSVTHDAVVLPRHARTNGTTAGSVSATVADPVIIWASIICPPPPGGVAFGFSPGAGAQYGATTAATDEIPYPAPASASPPPTSAGIISGRPARYPPPTAATSTSGTPHAADARTRPARSAVPGTCAARCIHHGSASYATSLCRPQPRKNARTGASSSAHVVRLMIPTGTRTSISTGSRTTIARLIV